MRVLLAVAMAALPVPPFAPEEGASAGKPFDFGLAAFAQGEQDNLSALMDVLKGIDDPAVQLDILKGIRDGLGKQTVKMPKGWPEVSTKLGKSPMAEVRGIVRELAACFGDTAALEGMMKTLTDPKADAESRKVALETLLGVKFAGLPPVLQSLIGDAVMQGASIRALAAFDDAKTPSLILSAYPALGVAERRDAVNTLASRKAFALELVTAVQKKVVPRGDLTAATIRQLGEHRDVTISNWISTEWKVRETPEARVKAIAEMKAMVLAGPKGDASRGRALFARTCVQCHSLFEPGGKVGPELTGANRSEIDYLLSNIMDPSAVVGKDYQATTVRTKSDRVVSGIIKLEDRERITLMTENDTIVIPRAEIDAMKTAEISMMPEGLLAALSNDEIRDLFAYLQSPFQVPLPQGAEETIFNGKDLTGWDGNKECWKVDGGDIVGTGPQKKNEFLYYSKEVADFRLTLEVKLVPNGENSGIQFRSQKLPDGHAKGYQADVGAGWWGKLYHEHGRALLWNKPGDEHVKKEDWNTYEILAVGTKIRTAVNGKLCVDFTDEKADPATDLKGFIAVQIHSGKNPMEVRFRNIRLEHNPKFELKTAK
jgi:putative heme-binding domain-containing protein